MSDRHDGHDGHDGAGQDGEFALLGRLERWLDRTGRGVVVGPGDDAAVLDPGPGHVVLTLDTMVEGRHFLRGLSSMGDVGWKLVAVNVSDLAAMGARPLAAVVGLCRPEGLPATAVEDLYAGMRAAADRWSLALVGGDTVAGDTLTLSLAALGTVARGAAVRRSGARAGDVVVVAGQLGAAAAALALHRAGLPLPDDRALAHRRPEALPDAGRALAAAGARAMIDVSDGFGADLGHLCRQSGVGADVEAAALPVAAGVGEAASLLGADPWEFVLGGGDDYALVAALPPDDVGEVIRGVAEEAGVRLAAVGTFTDVHPRGGAGPGSAGPEPRVRLDGRWVAIGGRGFDHFRRPRRVTTEETGAPNGRTA